MRSSPFLAAFLFAGLACAAFGADRVSSIPTPNYQIAVYYWPNWHVDPSNEAKLGKGWSEWELVKTAKPKFPGHDQPRVPLWGYRDESDPKEMARSIDAMADHAVTAILFDWYRFDTGGILDAALDQGFLRASNRLRLQFALMWANEDYSDIFPIKSSSPTIWNRGEVSRPSFNRLADEAVRKYFSQPNYWKIDGKPYFSVYVLQTLIQGLGGLEQTRDALNAFRARAKAAGFPGMHLNVIGYGLTEALKLVKGEPVTVGKSSRTIQSEADLVDYLSIDSVTWYTWAHVALPTTPTGPYDQWASRSVALWPSWQHDVRVPFYPNVTLGWDGSPRNYPCPIVVNTSPVALRKYLEQAKSYLDRQPPERRILTVNSWNEWTEGSALEPDKKWGLAYLDAIRQVFGSSSPKDATSEK